MPARSPDDTRELLRKLIALSPDHTATSLGLAIGDKGHVSDFLSGRKRSLKADAMMTIEGQLGLPLGYLVGATAGLSPEEAIGSFDNRAVVERAKQGYRPEPELLGKLDLKVFASAECGPGQMMVFSTDPIEVVPRPWFVEREPEAFGVVAAGDSMEPVHEAGDIVIVSPRAALVKGKDAVFTAEPTGGDFKASLKRYRGQTTTQWLATQFNPPEGQSKEVTFERGVWRRALRVVGKFTG